MDFEKLVPFIKRALESQNVTPEEVYSVLKRDNSSSGITGEDTNNETVDNQLVDPTNQTPDEQRNDEGQLLESTFQELLVEDAIEKAKEEKLFNQPAQNSKTASYWDLLRDYGNNHWKASSKE